MTATTRTTWRTTSTRTWTARKTWNGWTRTADATPAPRLDGGAPGRKPLGAAVALSGTGTGRTVCEVSGGGWDPGRPRGSARGWELGCQEEGEAGGAGLCRDLGHGAGERLVHAVDHGQMAVRPAEGRVDPPAA